MPRRHDVRFTDVELKRLGAVLAIAYDRDLRQFADVLLLEKLGPRTLQSLALIAEIVHGTPVRFSDPARFSFAHGDNDGHPFPVPLKTYDRTIDFLRSAVDAAKLGDRDKLEGLQRLERLARAVEAELQPEADFTAVIARERTQSSNHGGRSGRDRSRQLSLF